MAVQISEGLQTILDSRAGIPDHAIKLYDTTAGYPSLGWKATYYRIRSIGTQVAGLQEGEDITYLFGPDQPFVTGVALRSNYEKTSRHYWGTGLPLGITEDQISDLGWGAVFDGYFIVGYQQGKAEDDDWLQLPFGDFTFRVFTPMYCRVWVNNDLHLDGQFPRGSINGTRKQFRAGEAIPIRIAVATTDGYSASANPQINQDNFLALQWKYIDPQNRYTGDGQVNKQIWQMADAGHIVPGATVSNEVGQAIGDFVNPQDQLVEDPSLVQQFQDWTHASVVSTTGKWQRGEEYVFTYSHEQNDIFRLFVNDTPTGMVIRGNTMTVPIGEEKTVTVKFGNIQHNSISVIRAPEYQEPLVNLGGLPHIENISEQRTRSQATTVTFSVPVTKAKWNPNRVTPENCYSYDPVADAHGVLRKNRHLTVDMGYSGHMIRRFRGFISEVELDDSKDSEMLRVTCIDMSKPLIETTIEKLPDPISWLLWGESLDLLSFDISVDTRDPFFRPPAYDGWEIVDAVRDMAMVAGIPSRSLFGRDENYEELVSGRNRDRLNKSFIYPFRKRVNHLGAELSADYAWEPQFGESYWDMITKVSQQFGRPFRFTTDGLFDMRMPDNPALLKLYIDPVTPADNEINLTQNRTAERIEPKTESPEQDLRGIRGFVFVSQGNEEDAFMIRFKGYGLSILVTREESSNLSFSTEVDGILVDGQQPLDEETGDVGAPEYLDNIDNDGRHPIQLVDENGNALLSSGQQWYYKDGVHPTTRHNPCLIPIARNLRFGWHTVKITTHGEGTMRLDGAFIFKRRIQHPEHVFSVGKDTVQMSNTDSEEDMRNQVTVVGSQRGADGNSIVSKAVDVRSVLDPKSPAYLGYTRSLSIIDPTIRNQASAEYMSLNVLTTYSRAIRAPSISSVGIPHLEEGDCVAVDNLKFGYDEPIQFLPETGQVVLQTDTRNRFWVESMTLDMSKADFRGSFQVTPYPPVPAHEPFPDPPDVLVKDQPLVQNFTITTDDDNASGNPQYNPYNSDLTGSLVKIEFDLMQDVKSLEVTVHNFGKLAYHKFPNIRTKPWEWIERDQIINTLFFTEDGMTHGHYVFYWDGWWADDNNGGSPGGGKFFPVSVRQALGKPLGKMEYVNGTIQYSSVYFRVMGIKERDGTAESFEHIENRASNPVTINGSTSSMPITIYNDDYGYSADQCTYSYSNAVDHPLVTRAYDFAIYDDDTSQATTPGRLQIKMVTDRPGMISIRGYAFLYQIETTGNTLSGRNTGLTKVIEGLPVLVYQSPETMPAGSYSFYFTPGAQLRNAQQDALEQVNEGFIWGLSRDGFIPFNFVSPRFKDRNKYVWSCWLFYFPGMQNFTGTGLGLSAQAGITHLDKGNRIISTPPGATFHTNLVTDGNPEGIVVQWYGNSQIYSTTGTYTASGFKGLPVPLGELDGLTIEQDGEEEVNNNPNRRYVKVGGSVPQLQFVQVRVPQ